MNYKEYFERIGDLPGVLLFSGEEEYVKQEALKKLRATYLPAGVEALNEAVYEGAPDIATLEESCETLPFMGERRLVILRNCPFVTGENKGAESSLADEYIRYIGNLPPHAVLLFYLSGKADKRKKLSQRIIEQGGGVDFDPLLEREIQTWCTTYASSFGKNLDSDVASTLTGLVGGFLLDIKDGLDKALFFAGERSRVTKKDVEAIVTPSVEFRSYEMAAALLDGSGDRAVRMLKQLRGEGEKPLALLGSINRSARQLLTAKLFGQSGGNADAVAKMLGVSTGAARAIAFKAKKARADFLRYVVERCNEADFAMKTRSMSEETAEITLYGVVFSILDRQKGSGEGEDDCHNSGVQAR